MWHGVIIQIYISGRSPAMARATVQKAIVLSGGYRRRIVFAPFQQILSDVRKAKPD